MSQFAVGEVAIIGPGMGELSGLEVTILEVHPGCLFDGAFKPGHRNAYLTSADKDLLCECALRKKRPPPDWVTLCHLQDLPLARPKEPA